jgi:group I intron endonuclease
MAYIYKTTNLVNNKIYIGQTKKSKDKSTSYIGSGKLLVEAIKEFGKSSFTKIILEEIETDDIHLIDEREIFWIEFYDSRNRSIGYNTTKGGSGWSSYGLKRSEETKLKQSNIRIGVSPWNKGIKNPYTEEQIQKMLDNRINKDGWKKIPKFEWICPKGNFDTRQEVSKLYNVTPRTISLWCDDENKPEFNKIKIIK